ncbi:uncharacterized protein LOC133905448 [Phragmites australis]|uniref:uncharacterized protein LOC133905448 n=1 Tax=Phragmites australis TaxID=29695 RepID=UPI002D773D9D|nr:uncharacterized protein LOC133905448 [Phragmites australis]
MGNRPQYMIFLTLLLVTSLQAQGVIEEQHLAGGKQEQGGSRRSSSSEEETYVPVSSVVYRSVSSLPGGMPHEPFETCSGCRCCARSNASDCVNTQCCFGINCNLPGKPYGTCAFWPRSCGCGPNNCTKPSPQFIDLLF